MNKGTPKLINIDPRRQKTMIWGRTSKRTSTRVKRRIFNSNDKVPEQRYFRRKKKERKKETMEMKCEPSKTTLVVNVLGRDDIGLKTLIRSLNEIWQNFDVFQLGKGFSRFGFLIRIAREGPFRRPVGRLKTLPCRPRDPSFKPADFVNRVVSVDWVRVTGDVAISGDVLLRLGNMAGKVIQVDDVAARVCVEVDLGEPLESSRVSVEGKEYNVEYEGIRNVCLLCGKYGEHDRKHCLSLAAARARSDEVWDS